MTEEEARKIRSGFANGYEYPFGGGDPNACDMCEVNLHAGLLAGALSKQIPKKPVDDGTSLKCPLCNYTIARGYLRKMARYCKWCGQAIDWKK